MSFIHASFMKKTIKTNSFDELRRDLERDNPTSINLSIKPHHWKQGKRDTLKFNLRGSFSDINKELNALQKKFKNI